MATLYVPGIPNPVLVISLLVMSAVKFYLVVGFFMHLKYDHQIMRALFVGPLIIADRHHPGRHGALQRLPAAASPPRHS